VYPSTLKYKENKMNNVNTQIGGSNGIDPKEAQKRSVAARKANTSKVQLFEEAFKQISDNKDLTIELCKELLKKALNDSDKDILKYVFDHIFGKATQPQEITGKDGSVLKAAGTVVIIEDNGRDKGFGNANV